MQAQGLRGSSIQQIAFASFVGTTVEWYDFFLYGTTAALVFPKLFFPQFSPFAATLASFATFGVGLFARLVGGIAFGHFGDRIGRKSMLVITLLVMGGATFCIGLVPTFEQVGVFAPVLLVLLRFLQGFAVGGEWGGAMLIVVEHAAKKNRTFYASWPQLGVPAGLMLSTAVFGIFSSLPDEQFYGWAWRVPFLLSVVLIAIGLFIRLRVMESPVFADLKKRGLQANVPLAEILRDYRVASALAIGVFLILTNGFYIVTTFSLSYATAELGVSRSVMLVGVMLASAAEFAAILIFSRLAERVGKRPVALWSAAAILLCCYPYFWLLDSRVAILIWLGMSLEFLAGGALYGIAGAVVAELFPARLRYSGISFGYQMAGFLGGALAPFIATALIERAQGASWPVATYMAANACITLVSVFLVSESHSVEVHVQVGESLAPEPS